MGKKILSVYLAKNDTPYSAAYAKLEMPASPWEVWDAMEKVRLQTDDAVFKMLDFAGIGRMMRHGENGVFVNSLYVLRDGELTTAPPVQKTLPEKPGYLFRLTLGLHPDIGDARTVTLDLPAAEAELLDAQAQLCTEGVRSSWKNSTTRP